MKYKTTKKVILLSLKEQFFNQMLNKTKKFEFRKQFPNESVTAVVYLSSPVMKVSGIIEFDKPIIFDVTSMKEHPLITPYISDSLAEYFDGKEIGYAVPVLNVIKVEKAISLAEIRAKQPSFQPPQSYCYLNYNSYLFNEFLES